MQFARIHEGFSCVAGQRELRLDGADGVRPVASIFDGLARRADLETVHERQNAPVTTPNTPDTIVDHDTPSISFAVAVLVMLSVFHGTESQSLVTATPSAAPRCAVEQ